MNDLRTAAQKLLDFSASRVWPWDIERELRPKMEALRAALAQTQAEPVQCERCGHTNWVMEGKAPCQITEGDRGALAQPQEDPNQWREAIDEALVIGCLEPSRPDETPAQALDRLIDWETTIALDPAVSERAAALLAAQPQTEPAIDCRTCRHYTTASGGCLSVIKCVDGVAYQRAGIRQYWRDGNLTG